MIDPDTAIAPTGVGAITPLGDATETWSRLLAGESGLEAAPEALRRAGCQVIGRSSATRSRKTVRPPVQPMRSAITVAGMRGNSAKSRRMAGSCASTPEPRDLRL